MNTKIIPLFQPWIGNLTILMSCLSGDPDLFPCKWWRVVFKGLVWSGLVFGSLRGWTKTETGLPLF